MKDSEFQPGSSSLYWANMNELDGKMAIIEATQGINWKRASEDYAEKSLFGEDGVKIQDM